MDKLDKKRLLTILVPVIIIAIVIIVILIATGGGDDGDNKENGGNDGQVDEGQPVGDGSEESVSSSGGDGSTGPADTSPDEGESGQPSAPSFTFAGNPRVLAWQSSATSDGRLVALQSDEMPAEQYVFPGGLGGNRIQRCGLNYQIGDQGVIVFIGSERGELVYYPLDGSDPVSVGTTKRLTCAGPDLLQVFPGGQQIAYIQFDDSAPSHDFHYGKLMVSDLGTGNSQMLYDHTVAFAVGGDSILALNFYPDGKGNAAEVDVDLWTAEGTRPLLANPITPQVPEDEEDAECGFINGALAWGANHAYVLLGQTCRPGGSQWRLIRVGLDDGTPTAIASGTPGGGFFAENFATQVFLAADESAALLAVPSGMAKHVAQLFWVRMDGTIRPPVAAHVLANRIGDAYLEGQHLQLSPDGRALAYIQLTLNQEQSLWLLDLVTPEQSPQELITLDANEEVTDYRWTPEGQLFFIAGSEESNTLWLAAPYATPQRITRGRFTSLAPTATGQTIAVAEWIPDPERENKLISRVALVDLSGNIATLWQGASGDEVGVLGVE